ncbi:MAG TPA: amidase [Acidimicrobiia bacterium]|nr:amidase [Acidimicrobiia bacterium]
MSITRSPTRRGVELWRKSALELAQAIRSRQASSREVVEAHLRRIEDVNPSINAVTVVLADRALAAAALADDAVVSGDDLPPFHGVPFTVKENIDLVGAATTQGLRALAGAYPTRDAPAVERLRAAGGIPLGHTNCPTIAVRWHTDSEMWGATVNPWDRSRTPGASSGGEAAALATGMSPLGLGNDMLGSLRWPAQCCGVSALKPTLGRIPHASSIEPADMAIGVQLTDVEGPMARRISDLRAAFETLSGPTWRDAWTVPAPLRGPELAKPIRVALVVDPEGGGTADQVKDGVRKAADVLADSGYSVVEVEPPSIGTAAETLLTMLNTPDIRAVWQAKSSLLPGDTQRFLSAFYEVAGDPDPVTTLQSFMTRQSLLRAWGGFLETYPLIVAPVYTDIPFEVGTDLEAGRVAETIRGMRMTMAVNALGLPAVAVPVGINGGLPQVVQVIGPRYREDLSLDAAEAIENSVGIFTPIEPVQPRGVAL